MTGLATELDKAISQAVTGLRAAGYSWAEIAARLGVTRQAAQQRWGHRETEQDRSQDSEHRTSRRLVIARAGGHVIDQAADLTEQGHLGEEFTTPIRGRLL